MKQMQKLHLEEFEGRDLLSLTIVPIWDSSIGSDPNVVGIESTINTAIQNIEALIANSVTVDITFQEGGGLGESTYNYMLVYYSDYRASLAANATSPADASALSTLPQIANNPVTASPIMAVADANAIALGLAPGTATGTITLNTSICFYPDSNANAGQYSLRATAAHEIDEVLGFGSSLNGLAQGSRPAIGPVFGSDLYRFSSPGVRSYDTNANTFAYFSINGGQTNLDQFNQNESGDMMDWAGSGQVQSATGTPGAAPRLNVELTELDVIGYTLNAPAVVSLTVNDGGVQRSMVDSLTVVFSQPVTVARGAFSLALKPFVDNGVSGSMVGDASTTVTVANPSSDGVTWVLTFSGSTVVGGSISDGDYFLSLAAGGVGVSGDLGVTNGTYQSSFYRLFGDANGSGIIGNVNYNAFKSAFGAAPGNESNYNAAFDYYGNGFITNPAYNQFKIRFGTVWSGL